MIRSGYKLGDWLARCDRCSDVLYASQLKKEWTGWRVCDSCWEPRHPQEFLKGHPDASNVPWTRPDDIDATLEYVGDAGKTLVSGTNAIIQDWNEELTNDRVIILDSSTAQKGDRFIIYKTTDDDNKLTFVSTLKDSNITV